MTLLAVLLGLAMERMLRPWQRVREPAWIIVLGKRVRALGAAGAIWDGPLGVLIAVVPGLVAIGLLQWLLGTFWFGVLGFVFAVIVLWFCLGPNELDGDGRTYLSARADGDDAGVRRAAARIVGEDGAAVPSEALDHAVTRGVLTGANERIFAVVFWFAILGPLGAVLYRQAAALRHLPAAEEEEPGGNTVPHGAGFVEAARSFHWVLAWIPARLLALAYALAGSFEDALEAWRRVGERTDGPADVNEGVLEAAGMAALRLDQTSVSPGESDPVHGSLELVWRGLVIWLVVIALLTIGGLAV